MNGRTLSRAIQSSEAGDDRGDDQDGDPRREGREPGPPATGGRSTNGGRRERGGPTRASAVGGARDRLGRARPSCRRLPDVDAPSEPPRPPSARARGSAGGSSVARAVDAPPTRPARARRRLGDRADRARPGCRVVRGRDRPRPRPPGSRSGRRSPVGHGRRGASWLDIVLTERLPRWRVREALDGRLPAGWSLVDLDDVWLGGPALAGLVAAADYRVDARRRGDGGGRSPTRRRALLARPDAPARARRRAAATVAYDLRPLLVDVAVGRRRAAGRRSGSRTRFHPTLGHRAARTRWSRRSAMRSGVPLTASSDRARAARPGRRGPETS